MIGLLAQVKLEMSNLYGLLAERFPKYKEIWLKMAQQEINHADQIRMLHTLVKENRALFFEKMTKTYTVKKVLEIIREVETNARGGKLTLIGALSLCRDLEGSIILKDYYDYFKGRDNDTKFLIHNLRGEAYEHQFKLKKLWEEERKN